MLNMVLAIIMDVYSNVKGAMGNDVEAFPTIWSQSYETYRRWSQKKKGNRLSLGHILHALEMNDSQNEYTFSGVKMSKLISVSTFMSGIPGLNEKQADRLLGNAMNHYDSKAKSEARMEDCLLHLRGVDLKVQQVQTVTDVMEGIQGLTDEMNNAVEQCRLSLEATRRLSRRSLEDANGGVMDMRPSASVQSSRIVKLIV